MISWPWLFAIDQSYERIIWTNLRFWAWKEQSASAQNEEKDHSLPETMEKLREATLPSILEINSTSKVFSNS